MVCEECKIDYPTFLVNTFTTLTMKHNLCGICALAASNKIHGVEREKFNGRNAELLRLAAIQYRKDHNLPL